MQPSELLRDVVGRIERVTRKAGKESAGKWQLHCPGHGDDTESLSVAAGDHGIVLKCFAGCSVNEICAAIGIEVVALFYDHGSSRTRTTTRTREDRKATATVEGLAADKGLPAAFLRELGCADGQWTTARGYTVHGVTIPYFTPAGERWTRVRLRSALGAKFGSSWSGTNKDGGLIPYGLDRLAREKPKALILVEGESDCWTLWHAGFPALGLPGASTAGKLTAALLAGVERLYVCREPDLGGMEFAYSIWDRLAEIEKEMAGREWRRPEMLVFSCAPFKDPNAAWTGIVEVIHGSDGNESTRLPAEAGPAVQSAPAEAGASNKSAAQRPPVSDPLAVFGLWVEAVLGSAVPATRELIEAIRTEAAVERKRRREEARAKADASARSAGTVAGGEDSEERKLRSAQNVAEDDRRGGSAVAPLSTMDDAARARAEELRAVAKLRTDTGNAARFVLAHGEDLLYCAPQQSWYAWDGSRWRRDDLSEVELRAKATALSIGDEAKAAKDADQQRDLFKHAAASQAAGRIAGMIRLARCEVGIRAEDLDSDGWRLNLLNGTMDLRSGKLMPHDRADRMTMMAPVEFDANADCPRWRAFLKRIMGGSLEMMTFLATVAGLSLTGDVSEQYLFVFWGAGANGKNTFLDTISGMLGDYATHASEDLLLIRKSDEHPTAMADLRGRRLVVASETEEGARLKVQLVKRLTGDATLKGRHMREDYFEFPRTHKLVLVTNNKPVIRERTHAIWRRVRLVPFAVAIPEAEQDKHLTESLRAEWPGILNWAIDGCLTWQRLGRLYWPAEVGAATDGYRRDSDPLGEFLAARCVLRAEGWASRHELWEAYQGWANSEHERYPYGKRQFLEALRMTDGISESAKRLGAGDPVRGFQGVEVRLELAGSATQRDGSATRERQQVLEYTGDGAVAE